MDEATKALAQIAKRQLDDAQDEITRLTSERDQALAKCDSLNEKLGTWMGMAGKAEARYTEALSLVEAVTERADSAEKSLHEAKARAAASAMEMRKRAADYAQSHNQSGVNYNWSGMAETIRTLPIDPDAQKALDRLLAKAREDAIREAAHLIECDGDALGGKSGAAKAILALLNDGDRP